MTPHIQTVTDDGVGNCFATCLACILDLPAESVPNFKAIQESDPNACMVDLADGWLREHHGKRIITIELYDPADGPNKGRPLTTQPVLNRLCHRNRDELVILSGVSPRQRADGGTKYHCVVARPSVWGFEIVHDPHPDGRGIVGLPYGVKWIVPVG
jgi:hypothetical protein